MYFHGLEGVAIQLSRLAISADGIHFQARPEVLGRPYLRVFRYGGVTYALAMPGQLCRSEDGFHPFEAGPRLFGPDMRHSAVMVRDDRLWVFWTRVGDAPPEPSVRSTAYGQVNQLRDPALFEDEDGRLFLLYAVAGESGIAIAEVFVEDGGEMPNCAAGEAPR